MPPLREGLHATEMRGEMFDQSTSNTPLRFASLIGM